MSFCLILPGPEERAALAAAQERCYWSAGADLFLRKWGLIALATSAAVRDVKGYFVVARGASAPAGPGFREGPFAQGAVDPHGIATEDRRAGSVMLRLADIPSPVRPGHWPGKGWGRPVDTVRRIPAARGEVSDPYELQPGVDDPASALHYQRLVCPPGWTVLAELREVGDDAYHPVVISDGTTILSGLPLLDLAIEKMSMPDCPDGYYAPARSGLSWQVEAWLAEMLVDHARRAGAVIARLHPWPDGRRGAFTVRHDYDRPITGTVLHDLIAFYDAHGVRASVSFLTRLLPADQIARLRAAGHEIVLHSEASSAAVLTEELARMAEIAGAPPASLTCHGGIGSAGHLGGTLFRWCADAGLSYIEQLGRDHLLPHPAVAAAEGDVARNGCMVMPCHHSLDRGTAPLAHELPILEADGPIRLASGGVFNVMNHPDIHLSELKALIGGLDLRNAWCATHDQITDWCRTVKFDSVWHRDGDHLHLAFPQPLPHTLNVEVVTMAGAKVHSIVAGQCSAKISLSPPTQPEELSMPNVLHSFGNRLERMAAAFRKPAGSNPCAVDVMSVVSNQPRRAALVVRSLAEADQAKERLKACKGLFRYFPDDLRIFSLSGGSVGLPVAPGSAASFFHTNARGLFDLVFVDPAVKLFDTAYGAAFVAWAARLVAESGRILLPNWDAQHPKSGIRSSRLAELLGGQGKAIDGEKWVAFTGPLNRAMPASVLTWYLNQGAQLVVEELAFRNGAMPMEHLVNDPIVMEFLLPGEVVCDGVRGARSGSVGTSEFRATLEDIVGSHAYLVSGVSYKSAILRHIIDKLMPGRTGLVFGDVGGGFGALAGELLASSDRRLFARATTRDIASQNIFLARNLYSGLHPQLGGRFKFSLGPAETFPFEGQFDVLSFVGSLLYVDKAQLSDVVARAWASVRPGGLFIVHENIKAPAFARDHDVMFEADELNTLLSRHGEVRCFHSSVYAEVPLADAQNKTLFRVLQKPA